MNSIEPNVESIYYLPKGLLDDEPELEGSCDDCLPKGLLEDEPEVEGPSEITATENRILKLSIMLKIRKV